MADGLLPDDPDEVGPYRLEGRLGEGGMGQVFLGRTPGGRPVAVKVVHTTLARDAEFRRRFATEVKAARQVGGFYTAQVVDADTDADPPWLATAYVAGPSLHTAVKEAGALPEASVAVLGAGLAEGLAAVHAEGLVHRDLKPGNVVLGADGPRLIDFGIVRALDGTSLTHTRTVLGTLAFMSPEQAAAEEAVSFPSDVFSLGSVLAFAAADRGPFDAATAPALLYRLVHGDPDLSGVPEGLAGVVSACLAKDPDQRPSPDEVLQELSPITDPEAAREGREWLPEGITERIDQQRTRVLPPTRPTKRHDDDVPPGRRPRPGSERTREEPREATGYLRVGNLTGHPVDAVVDGHSIGTVAAFATAAFPVAAGRHTVRAKSTKHSRPSEERRRVRVAPGATAAIAVDFVSPHITRIMPKSTVAFDHDTREDDLWWGWGGLVVGLPFGFGFAAGLFDNPSGGPTVVAVGLGLLMFGLIPFLFWVLAHAAHWGVRCLTQSKAARHYTLALSADGLVFTHDGTVVKLSWDEVNQIGIVWEQKESTLVVWPREGHASLPGARMDGGTVLCELDKLGIGPKAVAKKRHRFRAALRCFAGDRNLDLGQAR